MKRLLIAVAFTATSACWVDTRTARGPAPTDFYGELAPYGEWVTVAPYGAVWRPAVSVVGPDFYPYYTGGWWVHTQYGWTWQSTFSWGWIPFHHGRWITTDPYGWVWVPGDEWSPAWVEWRVGGGNIGWVPLGPQGVATVFTNYHPRWVFVPMSRFGRQNFHNARLPPYQEYHAYRASTAIPFQRGDWRRGPSPELVRRAGGEVRAVPLPAPRALRPGDVRADPRLGPRSQPPPQARRPPPAAEVPSRRMTPMPGAPMPPASSPAPGFGRSSPGYERPMPRPGQIAPLPPSRMSPPPSRPPRIGVPPGAGRELPRAPPAQRAPPPPSSGRRR